MSAEYRFAIMGRMFYKMAAASLLTSLAILSIQHPVDASQTPGIRVSYIGLQDVPFRSLAEGTAGSGEIFYYVKHNTQPSLAVKLKNLGRVSNAYAYVYEAPPGHTTIPLKRDGNQLLLPSTLKPSLVITAQGGYWVRHGIPNYNLSVKVFGPIYALWEGGLPTNKVIHPGPLKNVGSHELLATIQTHTSASGVPLWDLRQLVPSFPGEGVYRVNYAQRESAPSSWTFAPSVSPLWPYVAFSGHFLQSTPNVLTPPIVVNWATGKITRFSEVVSVRSQANGYDFYSISPLKTGNHVINKLDFESPWGFYNLSPTPKAYPNLIIRTQHFYSNDPWSPSLLGKTLLINKPEENVRYSWADHPGNNNFDFKVDVFGFHSYTDHVAIAGGRFVVQAPSYHQYPSWVLSHQWPSTTFIDVQSGHYATTEGIYTWPAQNIGTGYWMGWTATPNLSMFRSIPQGLRGEYRVNSNHRPRLYVSPVDGRLHLLYAQGGLWNINHQYSLVERNLNQGKYINAWELVDTLKGHPHVVSQLYALPDALLYQGPHGVILDHVAYSPSAFTIMPPDSKSTWSHFVNAVSGYRTGNDPLHLSQWLNHYFGSELLGQGTIQSVLDTNTGFQFTLIPHGTAPWTNQIPGLGVVGRHPVVISYNQHTQRWSVAPLMSDPISVSKIMPNSAQANIPTTVTIPVTNHANYIASGTVKVMINGRQQSSQTAQIMPHGTDILSVPWTPTHAGTSKLVVQWNGVKLASNVLSSSVVPRTGPQKLWTDSSPSMEEALIVLLLVIVISGSGFWIWRRTL